MKAKLVKSEKNLATLTMEFTGEEFDAAVTKAYQQNKGKFAIDGFRKGKAPQSIIERHYGAGVFFEEAIDSLFEEQYPAAIEKLKLDPVDYPNVKFGEEKLEKGKGFCVTVEVTVAPTVELKEYKGIKAEKVETKVAAADVNRELEEIQKRNARLVSVDRKAKSGDTVILDYKGFVGEEQFAGGTADNQTLKLGSGTFIPGFEDQLIGTKAGDDKDVNVTFPEDYHEHLAGKAAVFHCHIHEVKEEELPKLDDDFAAEASEFDTLAEWKKDIKSHLEEAAKSQDESVMKSNVLKALCDQYQMDIPPVMIEHQIDNLMDDMEQQLTSAGLSLDMYMKYLNKDMQTMREEHREEAERTVKTTLLVEAIAKAEKIKVTAKDYEKEYAELAQVYGITVDQVKEAFEKGGNKEGLERDMINRKTVDFLLANAELTEAKKTAAKKETK